MFKQEGIDNQAQEIQFLETLLIEYQSKPLIIKGSLICKAKNLMNLVKIACQADKVELILNQDISCTSCTDTKYTYVSSILVTKDGKTQEFKYGFNDMVLIYKTRLFDRSFSKSEALFNLFSLFALHSKN